MDSKHIEELLERYWNCETSLEEEQQLREYFSHGKVPETLTETKALFRYFEDQKKKTISDVAFDGEVMAKVHSRKPGRIRKLFLSSMRMAAGIAVLMAAVWFVRQEVRKSTPQEMVDTYNDPELAFEETKKALLMISRNFGHAEEQAKKINLFNEAQEKVQGRDPEVKKENKF